ncbi:unnamed protein product [Adineta ricciae]|uniref:Uncharacterized protein n=1 Tax=Adineta ricciae TaxID=249248 RepID=A0A815PFA5_ADIRI|nr:unnamed protein product [Adineta ricciae]CAF1510159.1 unnamed protein product [Adineta ricciae]
MIKSNFNKYKPFYSIPNAITILPELCELNTYNSFGWIANPIAIHWTMRWQSWDRILIVQTHPHPPETDDDDRCMCISDASNHRVVKIFFGTTSGVVFAGGNEIDQLNNPADVILYNWSRIIAFDRQNLISFIHCYGIAMDNDENFYVSDYHYHVVRRWKHGEADGTKVAGRNGDVSLLNQLHSLPFIFVDRNVSVSLADTFNSRIMKWIEDAQEGIVVARPRFSAGSPTREIHVAGVIVDLMGNVYVSDADNCEITRWTPGTLIDEIVAKQYKVKENDDISCDLAKIAFDRQDNLYVVNTHNH